MKKIYLNDSDYIVVKESDDKPEITNDDITTVGLAVFSAGVVFAFGLLYGLALIIRPSKNKNKEKSK